MPTTAQKCSIQALPAEILCDILKAMLEVIVKQDMMVNPAAENRPGVTVGDLPFPHTMALVCRHWRDTVWSARELWTRIFVVLPMETGRQTLRSQLEKTGNSTPIDLTIVGVESEKALNLREVLVSIAPHIQRLRSLRVKDFNYSINQDHFDALRRGDAPLLECLRLIGNSSIDSLYLGQLFNFNCPALRILDVEENSAHVLNYRWIMDNLTNVEFVTISFQYSQAALAFRRHLKEGGKRFFRYQEATLIFNIPAALNAVPRRIPCLTFDNAQLHHSSYFGTQVGAERVILRNSVSALVQNLIDGNCRTIAFHNCNFHDLNDITRLPFSNELEFDGCSGSGYEQEDSTELSWVPANLTWHGDTVTIINSEFHCIEALLVLLRVDRSYSLWPRVTTLNLVAQGDFVMRFPLETLKAMIRNRRDAVVPGMVDEELDKMKYKGVRPIMVLHVHGRTSLSRRERSWFKKNVKDFVWD
ncbi:hypothetical protein AZE42_02125 [Rhizopogon vesiculosus]|uniref:Uncharacterized protein n=1 Tax=Rhizopogon vesiculosus TaxID=180088 RepID=A0A1J8QH20_9AGAM|nr:hypothetical protein AZE42_02125 [Rhizopogon vesiculosus]